MPELVNMKRKPEPAEKGGAEVAMDQEVYPWGLTLNLDKEALRKLGIAELPPVGAQMVVAAMAKVTNVDMREHEDGEHRSVTLQITDLGVDTDRPKVSRVKAMYPNEAG